MGKKLLDFFSALGRSLLLPIAALAACGILLGLTSALNKDAVLAAVPFLAEPVPHFIITTLNTLSNVVFGQLPVLFAIAIAFGLAREEKEIAAMAGFIGFYTFLMASQCMINSGFFDFSSLRIAATLGVETLDMGALAGIMTGCIVSVLHNKFHRVQFPVAVAFYGGKRFVAIITVLVMGAVGLVMPLIWTPISLAIDGLGSIISSLGLIGVYIFGTLERLLIPTGLHHVLNGLFRTTSLGGSMDGIDGCLNVFLGFLDKVPMADLAPFTRYLAQGKFCVMLFGLPAAAFAIYRSTPDEKKPAVKALMIAGVAACFVSGITEPLEFAFMFVAPVLFVFHALMGGLSFMLMAAFQVVIGNTGGGIIDFFVWGIFQPGSNWWWVLVCGPFFAVAYYFVFYTYLTRKKIAIDVADEDDAHEIADGASASERDLRLAGMIIEGLGGVENIVEVNNCLTRLRVDLKDMSLVDEDALKKTGALGFVKPTDTHIQVIYGPKVEGIANNVRTVVRY
ncbi:MAG TPA: PTS transporter subunit EIIC [Candidatus Coprousia avicola]|nr:PTS transporter subunit EIIC [Candidatus Coprousia avicola]